MILYLKNFNSTENNTRFKVLIKSISNEQSFEKSYHSIGDGPLSSAYYFHMQSPPPLDISINLWNVSVLSSREIFVKWNINQILTSIGYRIRWIEGANETNKESSLIDSYNESSVVLDNRVPFTVYKIMINTFNINGDGPIQETDLVRTDEDGM